MATRVSGKYDYLGDWESSGRYNDGLKTCERLLKKAPNDVPLQLWKAKFNLLLQHEEVCIQICKDLCRHTPAIVDQDHIQVIYDIINRAQIRGDKSETSAGSDVVTLWERAIETQAKSRLEARIGWYKFWIQTAASYNHWEDVRKAAQQGQRATTSPKHDALHYFYFCFQASGHIVAGMLKQTNELLSKTIATVTLKSLEKAAIAGEVSQNDEYVIRNFAELRLLCQVLIKQNRPQQLYDLMLHSGHRISSELGANDWDLVYNLLDLLEKSAMWKLVKDYTERLLPPIADHEKSSTDGTGDASQDNQGTGSLSEAERDAVAYSDASVWMSHAKAVVALNDDQNSRSVLLRDISVDKILSRSQALHECFITKHQVFLLGRQNGTVDESSTIHTLGSKLLNFSLEALRWESPHTWFDDVKEYLEMVSHHERQRAKKMIHEQFPILNPIEREVLCLKIDYTTCDNEQELIKFLKSCLELIGSNQSNDNLYDEIYLLAIAGLVRLAHFTQSEYRSQTCFLLGLCLAFCCREKLPKSRQGTILISRLLRKLGATSLAACHWQYVGIKNVLIDSLGHLLVERVGINQSQEVHPRFGKKITEGFPPDLINLLSWWIEMGNKNRVKLDKGLRKLLENGQWDQLEGFQDLRLSQQRSITLRTMLVERRRIQRFSAKTYDHLGQDLLLGTGWASTSIEDLRDIKALVNYEPTNAEPFHNSLNTGPRVNRFWIVYNLMIDQADCIMTEQKNKTLCDINTNPFEEMSSEPSSADLSGLTQTELDHRAAWIAIYKVAATIDGGKTKPTDFVPLFKQLIESVNGIPHPEFDRVLTGSSDPVLLPTSHYIQIFYLRIELFQGVSRLLAFVGKKVKGSIKDSGNDLVDSVRKAMRRMHEADQKKAKDWLKRLAEHDIGKQIREEEELGAMVERVMGGEGAVRRLADDVLIDARYALERIAVVGKVVKL
ncbi:MAG: hypothetical protein M1820_006473 [Bogoriella megaspora]|nr:MAG: hypothetical protein M1820_006473 [Bogoriella megaspora]